MIRLSAIRRLACLLLSLCMTTSASAKWKEQVLYSFQGGSDGATPAGGVVFDKAGNLYGVTTEGGSACPSPGCGTVFELTPPAKNGGVWTETLLYGFSGNDGSFPAGGVIIDGSGNLYGTTAYGGSGTCILLGGNVGCGVVYELSPPTQKGGQWTYSVLYNFQGTKDGQYPLGDLTLDKAGNLFGATEFGGGKGYNNCNKYYGYCGTVFELSPPKRKGGAWTEIVLHSFAGGSDGANPNGGFVFDRKGAIYGATSSGGNQSCKGDGSIGCGTVFKLNPPTKKGGAWTEKIPYTFQGSTDGFSPVAGVILNTEGAIYGAAQGGVNGGGIVFRLTPVSGGRWKRTIVYGFAGGYSYSPAVAVFDKSADLYGTTNIGPGQSFSGSVFRLRPPKQNGRTWNFSLLYGFAGPPDGALANAGLVFDKTGALFGATSQGGAGACGFGCGTVFQVKR